MKNGAWVLSTIAKLDQFLFAKDIKHGHPPATNAVANAYVVDELKDCTLEDIADLIVHLVAEPLSNQDLDTVEELQSEVKEVRTLLKEVSEKLQSITQSQVGAGMKK